MKIFIASFLFVVLAEMGNKTQLLAMAFATGFPAKTALAGVLVATLVFVVWRGRRREATARTEAAGRRPG